jgi:5'-phosphate synthase pdxT subunit
VGPRVGVLAVQGAFASHRDVLVDLGVDAVLVRRPEHLVGLDGLVIPGGESTTMSNLVRSSGLLESLRESVADGLPFFGTCAGMILLAERIEDGREDQIHLDAIPMSVRRNAYGRQIDSFETDLEVTGFDTTFHAVFIRAPLVTALGPDVEVLARHHGEPVLVRHGSRMASSFHPELTADRRVHRLFLERLSTHITR